MMEAAQKWVGQVARFNYPLRALLGATAETAVFQTQLGLDSQKKAAIKLIPADAPNARIQLSRWQLAAKLPHSRLLRLFETGECTLGDTRLYYAVTEFADEDLSQILSFRPLNPPEARQVLDSILEALLFLHGRGIVHSRLKPSNIMLVHGQVKLTFDGLASIGETRDTLGPLSPYDPPEAATGLASTAGDIWTLGMILVESLTLEIPAWQTIWRGDPIIPGSIPEPFLDIVRHCLRHNAHRRWTASEIVSRLRLTPAFPISLHVPERLTAHPPSRNAEPAPAPARERSPEPPPPSRPSLGESLRNLWRRLPSFPKPAATPPSTSPESSLRQPEFIPAPTPVSSVSIPKPVPPAPTPVRVPEPILPTTLAPEPIPAAAPVASISAPEPILPVPAPAIIPEPTLSAPSAPELIPASSPAASVSVPEPILPPPAAPEPVLAAPEPSLGAPEFIPAPSFAVTEPALPATAPSLPIPEVIPPVPPAASIAVPEHILPPPPAPEPVITAPSVAEPELIPAASVSALEPIPPAPPVAPVIISEPIPAALLAPEPVAAVPAPSLSAPEIIPTPRISTPAPIPPAAPSAPKPAFRFPSFRFPSIRLPKFRFPSFSLPSFHLPKFHLPNLRLPKFHFPKLRLPSFHFPKFTLPSFRLPDLHPRDRFQKISRWLNSRSAILPSLRRSLYNPSFLIPAALIILSFAAILIVPRLLTEQPHAQPAAVTPHSPAGKTSPSAAKSAHKSPAASKTSPKSSTPPSQKKSAPPQQVTPPPAPTASVEQPAIPASTGPRGAVLQQVLPSISPAALATIRGTVRISIQLHVSPSGNVLDAEFLAPGPSKIFAALTLDAARQWTFSPPTSNGDALPSQWLLLFQITQSGVSVSPQQTAP